MSANSAKRRLLLIHILVGMCIALSVIGIICLVSQGILRTTTYRNLVEISAATDKSKRIDSYHAAIKLEPGKIDAYLRLLYTYAEDGLFEKQESEEFLSLYNANHHRFSERSKNYGDLQKQVGLLYINGYNESTTTCIRMALPFLREAEIHLEDTDPDLKAVSCYCKIGSYYETYIWNATSTREVSVPVMESLLAEIEETLVQFHEDADTGSVYDYLGFSVAVCNLLFDQRDILAMTIPYERTAKVLDLIYGNIPEAQTLQRERTRELLFTLEGNHDTYYDMIDRAYTRKEAD